MEAPHILALVTETGLGPGLVYVTVGEISSKQPFCFKFNRGKISNFLNPLHDFNDMIENILGKIVYHMRYDL